jgi:hypothetical protein
VQQFLPDSTVLVIDSHDWNKDEFSLGTWMAYRSGRAMKYSTQLQESHALRELGSPLRVDRRASLPSRRGKHPTHFSAPPRSSTTPTH